MTDNLPARPPEGNKSLTGEAEALVGKYIRASKSYNTRRAYQQDLERFVAWGGSLPATPEQVAHYLAEAAEAGYKPATLSRWKSSISAAHTSQGATDPCYSDIVRTTMRGIKREVGTRQSQVDPLLLDEIQDICARSGDSLADQRDRFLLLIGFAGALRRSELAGLRVQDLEWRKEGVLVHLPQSKTDQEGQGQAFPLPYMRRWDYCPITELRRWLEAAGIEDGYLFRRVWKGGGAGENGITPEAVALIVKSRVEQIGLDKTRYAGHSLRSGLVTTSYKQGVNKSTIRNQTRHMSDQMLDQYIRDYELFNDTPLNDIR